MIKEHLLQCSTIDIRHIITMTDDIGILQFAQGSIPDPSSGHTLDDNARALIVFLNLEHPSRAYFCKLYFNFLLNARKHEGGWHNLRLADGFVPDLDSEDSQGRTFWACCAAGLSDLEDIKPVAWSLVQDAMPVMMRMRSPRAVAYALTGMSLILKTGKDFPGLEANAAASAKYLVHLFNMARTDDWHWFENSLTYCNGAIPHSLFAYYSARQDSSILETADTILGFLGEKVLRRGYLNIVGNRGWWLKGKNCPDYDQQPVDAASMTLACTEAYQATGKQEYLEQAQLAGQWYYGNNINRLSLYDLDSGGCHDALVPQGVNLNQGAESVLSLCLTSQLLGRTKARDKKIDCLQIPDNQ